jgi:membrane associated rhomboid family serine protease
MNHREHILVIAAWSLVAIVIAMLMMFAYAVVDPNFDTDKVLAIIGPAFQTIVGGFIGLITGIKIGQDSKDDV